MRVLFALSLVMLMTACNHPVPVRTTELAFGPPYRLNVSQVAVVDEYRPLRTPPHVELMSKLPPSQAVRQWVAARIQPAGQENRLEVVIKEGSIVHKSRPKTKGGVEGYFTKEQTEEYAGTLEVELKIYGRKILPAARVSVVAHRSLTLREDSTAMEREQVYRQVSIDLMNALDVEIDKNIRQYFSNYLL